MIEITRVRNSTGLFFNEIELGKSYPSLDALKELLIKNWGSQYYFKELPYNKGIFVEITTNQTKTFFEWRVN